MLHDACIDKPTPDNYTCSEQAEFEKCYFPFMTSALAAQWQGGFCQRTCERCSCAADSGYTCAAVSITTTDFDGWIHTTAAQLLIPPTASAAH